jgi:hypothetical protein
MNEHSRPCTDAACRVSLSESLSLIKCITVQAGMRRPPYERDAAGRVCTGGAGDLSVEGVLYITKVVMVYL